MKYFDSFSSELITSTVSSILANRTPYSDARPCSTTDRKYDFDYNQIETDEPGPFQTPVYYGKVGAIPAETFEKLFQLICSQPQACLLLFHQAIQGIKTAFYQIKAFIFS